MNRKLHFLVALPLLAIGFKFLFLLHCGSGVPHSDEWDDIGVRTLIPWANGNYSFADLFSAHSEHRVVWPRLFAIAVYELNGKRWDCWLELAVNAVWYSLFISFSGYKLSALLNERSCRVLFVALLLVLVMPFNWENALCGFQNQQYFMTAFSLSAAWLCLTSETMSLRWWAGYACAVSALFSVASGGLVTLAIALVTFGYSFKNKNIAITLLLVNFFMSLTIAPHVSANDVYHAANAWQFLSTAGKCLAWPWVVVPILAPLLAWPLLVLATKFANGDKSEFARLLTGVSIWLVLQALAIAYCRGENSHPPMFRYQDFLCFIPVVSLLCLFQVRPSAPWLKAAFCAVCLTGILGLSARAMLVDVPGYNAILSGRLALARQYLVTHDASVYSGQDRLFRVYPNDDVSRTTALLDNSDAQRLFPVAMTDDSPPKILLWWPALIALGLVAAVAEKVWTVLQIVKSDVTCETL